MVGKRFFDFTCLQYWKFLMVWKKMKRKKQTKTKLLVFFPFVYYYRRLPFLVKAMDSTVSQKIYCVSSSFWNLAWATLKISSYHCYLTVNKPLSTEKPTLINFFIPAAIDLYRPNFKFDVDSPRRFAWCKSPDLSHITSQHQCQ